MRRKPIRARHVLLAWLIIYLPWLPGWPLREWGVSSIPLSYVIDANLAAQYALIAFSLVILVGWVGQISLGQGAFVGIGAFMTGFLARVWGIPFPFSLPIVAAVSAAVAALLGLVALRVRGLYLAVATLIFAWMADAYLFSAEWLVGSGGAGGIPKQVVGKEGTLSAFDLSNKRTLYLVMLAAVAIAWYAAVNLRDSKTGRAFFAVRGSEMAAVSLGIDVTRYKLLAFALSGALAGAAGNLIMVDLRTVTPVMFQFTVSLFYLGLAVVGGLTSLGGGLAAGILFAGLSEVFFRVEALSGWLDIVTVGLLLAVLLGYPGGLGALGPALTGAVSRGRGFAARGVRAGWRRLIRRGEDEDTTSSPEAIEATPIEAPVEPEVDSDEGTEPGDGLIGVRKRLVALLRVRPKRPAIERRSIDLDERVASRRLPSAEELAVLEPEPVDWREGNYSNFKLLKNRERRPPILEAEEIVVRFGGLTAVDNVSVVVREHEIVGLIGPNGAGKTTTFNAIAGLNEPTGGTIRIFGEDATQLPVHLRARMGVGRTFQLIQLFPHLTVFDNLLVATHMHNPTGVFSHVALTGRAMGAEVNCRRQVRLVVELLGLQEIVDRRVAGLPFGVLRQVEIARALVTGAPLLMLDEPASGLDNNETDELAQLLYYLRGEIGVSILLIEHDVRLVTKVSDYIYAINQGRPLADGTPAQIQRNPDVIAAYLGQSTEDDGEIDAAEPAGAGVR